MSHQVTIHVGNSLDTLQTIADQSIQTCVTSPPYCGLRDYNQSSQIGLESTVDEYVSRLRDVFLEVRRILRDDGTLWLNLGDSYAGGGKGGGGSFQKERPGWSARGRMDGNGLKPKDLVGIPWRVAFALQADGWYLRQDIIWSKPNPMPESVQDRCTKSHEYVFLMSKSPRYYFDAEAISEPVTRSTVARLAQPGLPAQVGSDRVPGKTNGNMKAVGPRFEGKKYGLSDDDKHRTKSGNVYQIPDESGRRNRRSVWSISTKPFTGAHFATMPPELAELCIRAGSRLDDTILDPFGGAGTTGLVAQRLQRNAMLCELNPDYAALAADRIRSDNPMFCRVDVK